MFSRLQNLVNQSLSSLSRFPRSMLIHSSTSFVFHGIAFHLLSFLLFLYFQQAKPQSIYCTKQNIPIYLCVVTLNKSIKKYYYFSHLKPWQTSQPQSFFKKKLFNVLFHQQTQFVWVLQSVSSYHICVLTSILNYKKKILRKLSCFLEYNSQNRLHVVQYCLWFCRAIFK